MTVFLPPENRTRLPLLLGCRPSPASMMPAFTSSSLNLPMSANSFSLGITPASEFLLALTITMTRIVVLLLGLGRFRPRVTVSAPCLNDERARAGSTSPHVFFAAAVDRQVQRNSRGLRAGFRYSWIVRGGSEADPPQQTGGRQLL